MTDLTEFCKLFKVPLPVHAHASYYLNLLKQSAEFADLDAWLQAFEQLEAWAIPQFGSAKNYKLGRALPRLVAYLKSTQAYQELLNTHVPSPPLPTKNSLLQCCDRRLLLSVDLAQANYQVLKNFDDTGELESSWEALCKARDLHPTLALSKSWRQVVFGNTNPKRLVRWQKEIVRDLVQQVGPWVPVVFCSHDECVFDVSGNDLAKERVLAVAASLPADWKNQLFTLQSLGPGRALKRVLAPSGALLYKKLWGVPGSQFFRYFKQHVLGQPLDPRDLQFVVEGEVAQWVV
jgi:hypothetical protein